MEKIEILTEEYKILDSKDDLILFTEELNDDIAFSFFSKTLKKVALARNITSSQLENLINQINPQKLTTTSLINIQLIGGLTDSDSSNNYLTQMIQKLEELDAGSNILNIISFDVRERIHPNSFEVDGYHGGVREI
jgi:hypothetical protein